MGSLTPTIKIDDFAELEPKKKKGTTSFPVAQQTSKGCETPSICCIFCLLAHLLYKLPFCPDGVRQLPAPHAQLQAASGQHCHAPHAASPHSCGMASCGTGSHAASKVLSFNSRSWLWLSCCWFPFSLLTLLLLGTVSSLLACLIQAGAGWSWN